MNEEKVVWWRWLCAILVLLLGPVLIGVVFSLLYSVTSIFIPSYFRESQEEVNIIAGIVGIAAAIYGADNLLLSRHKTFLMVWSIVFATIWGMSAVYVVLFYASEVSLLDILNDAAKTLTYAGCAYFVHKE